MHTLEQIDQQLSPGNKFQIQQQLQRQLPRVAKAPAQELTVKSQPQVPRVRFQEPNADASKPTWMIVALPQEPIVKSPQKPLVKPGPIIKEPTYVVEEDSIAARIKARRSATSKVTATTDESIAERLLRRKQESRTEKAFPVLDPDTGQLLEYRQLLRHPKFKDAWNILAANEFGRLAQGIKGRVTTTDTIKFVHKSDIPQTD